jgi:hypothetical protein
VFRASDLSLPQIANVEEITSSATKDGRMNRTPRYHVSGMQVTLGIAALLGRALLQRESKPPVMKCKPYVRRPWLWHGTSEVVPD